MPELTDEEIQRLLLLIQNRLLHIGVYRPQSVTHKDEVYRLTLLENKLRTC